MNLGNSVIDWCVSEEAYKTYNPIAAVMLGKEKVFVFQVSGCRHAQGT